MTVEEYAELQRRISAATASFVLKQAVNYRSPRMTTSFWTLFLRALFPRVAKAREDSAELARQFYDAQRGLFYPQQPPHPFILPDYRLEWFAQDMEPAREEFLRTDASDSAVESVAARAMKVVENGGRRTLLRPVVEEDFEDPVVLGWARVATGRETCGFCMMLVSRGPVYNSAKNAGLQMADTPAADLFRKGKLTDTDYSKLMHKWHEGCDCKVVPVFDRADWPGRDAFLRAQEIWKDVTKGFSGVDALNAFRRAIERGSVDIKPMTIAA